MKTYEKLREEAEVVLESVGKTVVHHSESAHTPEDVAAVSALTDSYSRLYEEIQK